MASMILQLHGGQDARFCEHRVPKEFAPEPRINLTSQRVQQPVGLQERGGLLTNGGG